MGFLSRLFGGDDEPEQQQETRPRRGQPSRGRVGGAAGRSPDEVAVERYRYLLQTAPPETIEQAHAEAFAQLTPEQRRMVLQELSQELPEHERAAGTRYDDDPRSLARMATRAEMRRPGTLERAFGGMSGPGMGIGLGGLMAGSFLSSFAGVLIGSAIAQQFFDDSGSDGGDGGGSDAGDAGDDSGQDASADAGDGGDAGGDFGGDFGGGDFGGGDFGGDFGGGDF